MARLGLPIDTSIIYAVKYTIYYDTLTNKHLKINPTSRVDTTAALKYG